MFTINMDNQQTTKKGETTAELSAFDCGGDVKEYHLAIHANNPEQTFGQQLDAVLDTYAQLRREELRGAVAVFVRYYISDAANQADALNAAIAETSDCAVSIIQQPPLDGTKVALWAYLQTGMKTSVTPSGLYEARHGAYRHLWTASAYNTACGSEHQTRLLLNEYIMQLADNGCKLADNCIRTWFYVSGIDLNYHGMVKARNEVFHTQELTADTHFIASTGIGGRQAAANVLVQMDAYAIAGLRKEQIRYLHAPTHLNPTHEYGVSFERGTAVTYGDRRHVFISGTASINNRGEVVYEGDVRKQAARMIDNVEALLKEADCTLDDIAQMSVYLRDTADYATVRSIMESRFPGKPHVIVLAPVCRPKWLIEMECMAVKAVKSPEFDAL